MSLNTSSTIALMKKMLPDYIVNCFLSAGYDEVAVLCNMDISDNPNNGIAKVEDFINRRFASNPNYNPTLFMPFEFPPGHKERIRSFVQELKSLNKHCGKKRSTLCTESLTATKRSKTTTESVPNVTIESVYKQVRHRLNEWKKKLGESEYHLKSLEEERHYSIQVIPQMLSGFFKVLMRCHNSMKCSNAIKLQQKDPKVVSSPFSISNWTKHARSCFDKSSVEHHDNQPVLKSCLSTHNDNATSVSSNNVINLTLDSSSDVIPVNVENESQNVESYSQVNSQTQDQSYKTERTNQSKFLSWSVRKK